MNLFSLRKIAVVALFSALIFADAKAQFTSDYTLIKSSGSIPPEFLATARSLSEAEVKSIPFGKDHNAKQQFTIYQNYFLQNLLMNGDVLINDPLTRYVNKVADELLKNDVSLRNQLHIYVIKDPSVNAHAFDKGFIFINIGLLAQLENEAQLAYILSHEITHVVKKHSITEYVENIKLENNTSDYDRGNEEERNLARYRFSKEQETEADVEGLAMLKKSNYSIKTVNGAFDVLQYSYLPFELIDFNKTFFEDENLILPDTLFLKKTQDVKSNDDYDDTKSTHPNIRKRRGAIEADLKVNDEASRKKFIVSEDEFKTVRETARFELCNLYLVDRDYMNAIYGAYILLQKYPDNLFLKKIEAKALFNVSVNKSSKRSSGSDYNANENMSSKRYTIPDYNKIEGASQRVYYLMDNLQDKELTVLALKYVYKAHKKHPSDKTLTSLTDSLFSELINSNDLYMNDFSKKSKATLKAEDTVKVVKRDTTEVEESKYSKIKKQQVKVDVATPDENFIKYALVNELADDEFVARYTAVARGLTKKADKVADSKSSHTVHSNKRKDEPLLGIDKVVFIDPYYLRTQYVDRMQYNNYYESEAQQQFLADVQKKCADKLNLEYVTMTTKGMTTQDIDKYNDNAVMNDWLVERFKHGNNSDEVEANAENIKQLIDKLGTKYVAWSGVYNSKGSGYRNTYFFLVFNLETGNVMKYETRVTNSKDHRDLITSFVYNSVMHVAKKPK